MISSSAIVLVRRSPHTGNRIGFYLRSLPSRGRLPAASPFSVSERTIQ